MEKIEDMSEEEFNQEIEKGYKDCIEGKGIPFREAMKSLKTLENKTIDFSDIPELTEEQAKELKYRNSETYSNALQKWRDDSKELFDNPNDAEFMGHAFDNSGSKEVYKGKKNQ